VDGAQTAGSEVFRLVYRSQSLIPADERRTELGLLFTDARARNKRRGISGALLLSDDWFVQALEGDERVVRSLYARIENDRRHHAVELLEQGLVPGRVFARWAMARVGDDGDLPLIAHADGISVAAPRDRTTASQEEVLARMREAGRAAAPQPG
jgi:Sensors of blue-light using FAD